MAWVYQKDYPKTREEAIRRAMSVREEDIDYSDIPPLELREGIRMMRAGNKFKEMGKRNLAALNKLLHESHESEDRRATQNNRTNEQI